MAAASRTQVQVGFVERAPTPHGVCVESFALGPTWYLRSGLLRVRHGGPHWSPIFSGQWGVNQVEQCVLPKFPSTRILWIWLRLEQRLNGHNRDDIVLG